VSDRREAMCLALARVLPDDEYMPVMQMLSGLAQPSADGSPAQDDLRTRLIEDGEEHCRGVARRLEIAPLSRPPGGGRLPPGDRRTRSQPRSDPGVRRPRRHFGDLIFGAGFEHVNGLLIELAQGGQPVNVVRDERTHVAGRVGNPQWARSLRLAQQGTPQYAGENPECPGEFHEEPTTPTVVAVVTLNPQRSASSTIPEGKSMMTWSTFSHTCLRMPAKARQGANGLGVVMISLPSAFKRACAASRSASGLPRWLDDLSGDHDVERPVGPEGGQVSVMSASRTLNPCSSIASTPGSVDVHAEAFGRDRDDLPMQPLLVVDVLRLMTDATDVDDLAAPAKVDDDLGAGPVLHHECPVQGVAAGDVLARSFGSGSMSATGGTSAMSLPSPASRLPRHPRPRRTPP